MLICPHCRKATLVTRPVEGFDFTLEECSDCKGLWFDCGELNAALDGLAEKAVKIPADAEVVRRDCPHCRQSMFSFNYPGTYAKIELCRSCRGFWLDAREFEEIMTVRNYRLTHPPEPEAAPPEPEAGFRSSVIAMVDRAIAKLSSF